MKPLEHTGDSANIAYYRESGTRSGTPRHIWAEVLRSDFRSVNKHLVARERPIFHIRVNRLGIGQVAERRYIPRGPVPPGPLADKTVTHLVRQMLKGT